MSKRETKAQVILREAKVRLDAAEAELRRLNTEYNIANATVVVHRETYHALQRALAPKPRTSSNGTSKSPSKRASKAAATAMTEVVQKRTACSQCGEADDHSNHDKAYLSSHSFLQPLTAPSAKKKSSPVNGSKAGGEASLSAHEMSAMNASNAEGN